MTGPNGYDPGDGTVRTMTSHAGRFLAGRYVVARAAAWGVAAYLAGYLLTYGWLGGRAASIATEVPVQMGEPGSSVGEPSLATLVGEGLEPSAWAGWLFYNAHFVGVVEMAYPLSDVAVPNILLARGGTLLALFALPPVVLALAGSLAARNVRPDTVAEFPVLRVTLPAGVVRGMGVTPGYLPLAVVGAVLFSVATANESLAPLAPGLLASALVMGLLYPLVFGGLGGWVGARVAGSAGHTAAAGEEPTDQ